MVQTIQTTDPREVAYEYFSLEKNHGSREEIDEKKVSPELFEELCRVGFVSQGVDGRMQDRWQLTDFGKSQIESYLEVSKMIRTLQSL